MERLKMTVEMEVTESQALALQAMFEHWRVLGGQGSRPRRRNNCSMVDDSYRANESACIFSLLP